MKTKRTRCLLNGPWLSFLVTTITPPRVFVSKEAILLCHACWLALCFTHTHSPPLTPPSSPSTGLPYSPGDAGWRSEALSVASSSASSSLLLTPRPSLPPNPHREYEATANPRPARPQGPGQHVPPRDPDHAGHLLLLPTPVHELRHHPRHEAKIPHASRPHLAVHFARGLAALPQRQPLQGVGSVDARTHIGGVP